MCSGDLAAFTGKVSVQECGRAWVFGGCISIFFLRVSQKISVCELRGKALKAVEQLTFMKQLSCRSADFSHHRGDRESLLPILLSAVSQRADSDEAGAGQL